MRVKSSSNSTRVSNSIYKRKKANQSLSSSSSSSSSSLNGSYILEKHVRRRRILPSNLDLDNTSTANHLSNNITNDKIADSHQPKELEFVDNPKIVEYYINNRKDNKNICVLNYCNLLKNYISLLAYVFICIVLIFMLILSYLSFRAD